MHVYLQGKLQEKEPTENWDIEFLGQLKESLKVENTFRSQVDREKTQKKTFYRTYLVCSCYVTIW